jgi:DNA polymerase delta subunit 1
VETTIYFKIITTLKKLKVICTNNIMSEYVDFMVREWYEDDRDNNCHIYMFGTMDSGKSVCVDVTDFTPFFYVQIPTGDRQSSSMIVNSVREKMASRYKDHLIDGKFVSRKKADGFTNDKLFKFIRLTFKTKAACKNAQYSIQNVSARYRLFEVKNEPTISMSHIRNLPMAGWIRAENVSPCYVSRSDISVHTKWTNISPLDRLDIPPMRTLSFDIECYSVDGKFPDAEVNENYITQIGNTVYNEKTKEIFQKVFVVGKIPTTEEDNVEFESFDVESDMLIAWMEYVMKVDPCQLIGYNIDGFDWKYIHIRCEHLGLYPKLNELSKLRHVECEYKETSMSSNAHGYNSFNVIHIAGIGQIDLLHWFRKNKKLSSYKLDDISLMYLNQQKHPVSHKEIFAWSGPEGTPDKRLTVAKYCAQDTYLPVRLMQKFDILINLIEMSKVTRVPITWLITRGESIKVYSQVSYTARKMNYLIPAPSRAYKVKQKFQGATVLEPEYGAYNDPLCGMDFASLYPSIMIAFNLDLVTYVKDPKYLDIPGIEYKTFSWEGGNYTFVQNRPGIVTGILRDLWKMRKEKKKLMAQAYENGDSELAKVYNGTQLAIKISMNSVYGDLGSDNSAISCKPISACVTYNGRCMIEHSKKCAETWYNGAKNGYSDSIPGDEVVYVKPTKGGDPSYRKISGIGKQWKPFDQNGHVDPDKLQGISMYHIMTSGGWMPIDRIIKHKTDKKIVVVSTAEGKVKMTEDHIVFLENGSKKRAGDLKTGDVLKRV